MGKRQRSRTKAKRLAGPKPVLTIRDRVVALERRLPRELQHHPLNWRVHTDAQKGALDAVFREVGFVKPVDVYVPQAGDRLVVEGVIVGGTLRKLVPGVPAVMDGNLRLDRVPAEHPLACNVTDLTEVEAIQYLATADPLSALAEQDNEALAAVLGMFSSDDHYLQAMLGDLYQIPDEDDGPEADTSSTDGYQIVITCTDEDAQRELVAEFAGRGLNFRTLVA